MLENTPEFASYMRTYLPLWDVISLLIKQLEAVCKQVGRGAKLFVVLAFRHGLAAPVCVHVCVLSLCFCSCPVCCYSTQLNTHTHMQHTQYAIPLAVVDGKSLADLAHGVIAAGVQPNMQDLLVCIQVRWMLLFA